jgi:hypothetical protein
MLLLPGEKILQLWEEDGVVLTNYRIAHTKKRGPAQPKSVLLLDQITSYQIIPKSHRWMLVLSGCFFALSFIGASFQGSYLILFVSLPFSFTLPILYYKTKCFYIHIVKASQQLPIRVNTANKEEVTEMARLIEDVRAIAWRNEAMRKYQQR